MPTRDRDPHRPLMDTRRRSEILAAYAHHSRRFDELSRRHRTWNALPALRSACPVPGSEPSRRQLEVLSLIASGLPNDTIALTLGIKPETVKTHVQRLTDALGARNRANAVAIGFSLGLLPLTPPCTTASEEANPGTVHPRTGRKSNFIETEPLTQPPVGDRQLP